MKKLKWFLLSLIVVLFVSCSNKDIPVNDRIVDPHLIVENQSINEWLELENINYVSREDGLIEVQANFRNSTNNNKILAYKIDWMDKNGFVNKSILSKWTMIEVEERRNFIIHSISPSMKIKDFKIRLQEPTSDDSLRKDSYHYQYQGK